MHGTTPLMHALFDEVTGWAVGFLIPFTHPGFSYRPPILLRHFHYLCRLIWVKAAT
ncbi:hypothetical protein RMP37_004222 [Salmonella enterica]|nr:hypothetical protein [Salmonella enterica]SUI09824.1 Uncharacterised protein [Salmonella enterica subsp. enterica]